MKRQIMTMLACPKCRSYDLDLSVTRGENENVEEGQILCCGCKASYPIIGGIPRFAGQMPSGVRHQSRTYSYYHSLYSKESTFDSEQNKQTMVKVLGYPENDLRDLMILDAGCGIGRYSDVLADLAYQGIVVAMDISEGVDSAAANLANHANCYVIQGDVLNPPFRMESFDAVVSWGVIHHTPHPRLAFRSLACIVKPQGRLGIYVYEFHPVITHRNMTFLFLALLRQGMLIRPLRFICSRLPISWVEIVSKLCRMLCLLIRFDPFGVGPNPPENWKRVFIDRFQSRFAFEHSVQEIMSWFYEEGFDDVIVPGQTRAISMSGSKRKRTQSEIMNVSVGSPMIRSHSKKWV